MTRKTIPTRLRERGAATARLAAGIARNGAARLVRGASDASDQALGEALFRELDGLKGLAMKVGQILSYVDAGLPEEVTRRLAGLQHGVTPLASEVVIAEIERCLGASVPSRFDRFDLAPVAAASVGQVHRGRIGDQEVAIKVRYPGISETLDADTRQLRAIASLASLATAVDGQALVSELRERLLEECDYAHEARMQDLFAHLLEGDPKIVVPKVFLDRCGETVLTSAWWEGERFDGLVASPAERRNRVAATLVRFPWTTLLRHNVLHADPHPGNFLFRDEDRVVVLDYGCVKEFRPQTVSAFRELVEVVRSGQRGELARVAALNGLTPRPDRIDFDLLWAMLRWMLAPYLTRSFRFDPAWWVEGRVYSRPGNANARYLGITPDWLWLQRTLFGLHAVLTRLEAEGDFASVLDDALTGP